MFVGGKVKGAGGGEVLASSLLVDSLGHLLVDSSVHRIHPAEILIVST